MKVKHRFRRRSSVGEFDTRKVQQRWNPATLHMKICYGLVGTKDEDDMETKLEGSDEQIPTCTEVGMMQRRERQVDPG